MKLMLSDHLDTAAAAAAANAALMMIACLLCCLITGVYSLGPGRSLLYTASK